MLKKKLLLHDLPQAELKAIFSQMPEGMTEFCALPEVKHCIGCFGCWVKTPGSCVIQDHASGFPALLAQSDELIIVSRGVYGGLSPAVKKLLDRSIGYLLPYFRILNGEMHHTMRYKNPFALTVYFYGDAISEKEQKIGRQLVQANALNLGAATAKAVFLKSSDELKAVAF